MRGSGKGALGALLLLGGGLLAAELLRNRRHDEYDIDDTLDRQLFSAFNVLVDVIDFQGREKIIVSVPNIDLRNYRRNLPMTWQLDDGAISRGWRMDTNSLVGLPADVFHTRTVAADGKRLNLVNKNNDSKTYSYTISLVKPNGERLERDPSVRNGPGVTFRRHPWHDDHDWNPHMRETLRDILRRILERLDRPGT